MIIILSTLFGICLSGKIRPTLLLPSDGSIVHCGGQVDGNLSDATINTFNNYSNYLNTTRPQTMMVYWAITLNVTIQEHFFDNLTKIMNSYPDEVWYGIQMGLWFFDVDGNAFDCEVMNGTYDDNIQAMIKGFNKLGRPVWLRIGYGFNGQWTGFTEECYIGAYQRITKALRADPFCSKSCATVWDYTADSEYLEFMPWYPGDDYVDWWAVNVFGAWNTSGCVRSNAGISSPYVLQFIEAAVNRSFPVMIGASTPRQVGGMYMPNGCAYNNSWNDWYSPFFDLINNDSLNIKSFCYINWDWWMEGYNWGQAEINFQDCDSVGPKYREAIKNGNFMNVQDESSTKALLGM